MSGLGPPGPDAAPHPVVSIKNTEAIALALKAGLGLELCYVLMHALSWGTLVTAGVSAVARLLRRIAISPSQNRNLRLLQGVSARPLFPN